MSEQFQHLFSPLTIGPMTVRNRLLVSGRSTQLKAISDEKGTFIFHWALPAPLLAYGTPAQIEEQVREHLRIGAPGKRYVLSTDVPDDETPLANLLAVRDACRKYGTYPLPFWDATA